MPFSPPQQIRASLVRGAAVAAIALGLGGCLGRTGAETTGSLSAAAARPTSEAALRQASTELGRRYDDNPGEAAVSLEYAQSLRALGQRAQAVAVLQQAAIKSPRDLTVLAAYGKALADAGRLKEAAEVLRRAHHPERPDWRILSVQGVIADQLGDFEGAQRYYVAALGIVPDEPSVLSNQGLSYALARRLGEAEAILRVAASDRRAEGRVRQNLALVLGLQGKFAEAESVLKQDMPPAEAAQTLASIKRMVAQPNSWKAMRQQADAKPAAQAGAADRPS
ncbi:MAG: Tetratricopeptide 2 repeat protein [Enterovirga sp.]|nr:Tetratricopeptide 2 repeat protein [Enterovirga sp.]